MSRVIIGVHPTLEGGGYQLILHEPHSGEGWAPHRFAYAATDPIATSFRDGTGMTSDMGAYLVQGLRAHPAIGRALDRLMEAPANAIPSPIFLLMSADAENVPWETLFDREEFLALDRRWPIARIGVDAAASAPALFEPPLRVVAVLSAAEVPAAAEWDELFGALSQSAVPVAVHAFVAEDDLEARIRQAAAPNMTITVARVPPGRDLLAAIEDIRPHLLHLFAHGRVTHGFPEIQVATTSSWGDATDTGHVVLEPKAFGRLTSLAAPWVITMNVCRGAEATDTGSLAYTLLSMGFPAVAGMREPVSDVVARAFTKGFYRSLVETIGAAQPGGGRLDLDLPAALIAARQEICEQLRDGLTSREAAASRREWTLPVLYLQGTGVAIERREQAPAVAAGAPAGVPADPDSEERRTAIEANVALLRDMLDGPLPRMDARAVDAIRAEIARQEAFLYESPAHVPA
jgi:hypothetical protein